MSMFICRAGVVSVYCIKQTTTMVAWKIHYTLQSAIYVQYTYAVGFYRYLHIFICRLLID